MWYFNEHYFDVLGFVNMFSLFFSELLQSLDMCDNDPVAIARCFVIKVMFKWTQFLLMA